MGTALTIAPTNADTALVEAQGYYRQAAGLVITTQDEAELAADVLKEIKSQARQLDERRKAITRPLDDAKAKIMDEFRGPLDLLMKAETAIKAAQHGYLRECEKRRQEEQRRIDEQKRIQMEEAMALAADRKDPLAQETATELMKTAAETPPAPAPKVAGISIRKEWDVEITDIKALPAEYLIADVTALRKTAVATKGLARIPGARFFQKESVSSR